MIAVEGLARILSTDPEGMRTTIWQNHRTLLSPLDPPYTGP